MIRVPTYYELLDISSSATAEQIRGAYLRLMKRYHPDVAGEPAEAEDLSPLINEAYAALSDPAKRAAYDAGLARPARPARPSDRTATPAQPVPLDSRSQRGWRIWASLALVGGVAAVALAAAADFEPEPGAPASRWLQPQAPAAEPVRAPSFPSPGAIRREAQRAAGLPAYEAAAQSRDCFAAARAGTDAAAAAQLCIIFDDAYIYSHKAPSVPLPPYFQEVVVKMRHASALDVAPDDPLLGRLWQATFAALMADVGGSATVSAGSSSALPASQRGGRSVDDQAVP